MQRTELIKDLKRRTERIMEETSRFSSLSIEDLNHRNSPQSWSILECIEHLNRYGDFYLPEMEKRISKAQPTKNEEFTSSWLGNYFAMSMLPVEKGKLNKMKTFKSMNPIHKPLSAEVISKFMEQQKKILQLLELANQVDIGRVKTSISITKWIKLKLGDTLRVVIYHNQRHVHQANHVLKSLQVA